jgi:hypothetical protein
VSWLKAPKWGIRLAAAWFILYGAAQLASLAFRGLPELLAILAIAAGVLILIDR